jgi:hypothetical protein
MIYALMCLSYLTIGVLVTAAMLKYLGSHDDEMILGCTVLLWPVFIMILPCILAGKLVKRIIR